VKPEARATGRAPSRPNSFSEANGKAALQGPAPAASAAVATSPTGFTAKPSVEGPLVEAGPAPPNAPKACWPEIARTARETRAAGVRSARPNFQKGEDWGALDRSRCAY
jgi:hypothetical protein